MFKRGILAFALCALMVAPAFAKTTIGIANMQVIGNQCAPAAAAKKILDSRLGKEKKKLEKEAQSLQKRSADFQAQAATMSKTALQKKQQELMTLGRKFEEKTRKFSAKVQREENKMRQSLATIIMTSSESLAKKKKLDLIIDSGLGMVLYSADSLDVTDSLLKEVNNKWQAQGRKFK